MDLAHTPCKVAAVASWCKLYGCTVDCYNITTILYTAGVLCTTVVVLLIVGELFLTLSENVAENTHIVGNCSFIIYPTRPHPNLPLQLTPTPTTYSTTTVTVAGPKSAPSALKPRECAYAACIYVPRTGRSG